MIQVFALFVYSANILLDDFRGGVVRRLDISTTFSVMLCLTSFSHFSALSSWIDSGSSWATYLIADHLEKGLFIFGLGSCIVMETIRRTISSRKLFLFPQLNSTIFYWILIISTLIFIGKHFRIIPSLGTVSSFIFLIVTGSVFLLSFIAHSKNSIIRIYIVAGFAAIQSLYAIQFSYLRMEIVTPWLGYFLGEILARKRLLSLHPISKVIFMAGLVIYPVIFTYLGENRAVLSGRDEKLERVLREGTTIGDANDETLLGRLNVLGQLSNVVGLTEKKGLYDGYTLAYLSYVFVPRFLWPEKPKLDGGQWFAVEMGRSRFLPTGKATSSVNMTVPGEMYLNFGYAGLFFGCILFGLFIGSIWKWVDETDLLSWTFRFYLLFLGMFSLGSDLMIVPQLVAYLIIYKGSLILKRNIHA